VYNVAYVHDDKCIAEKGCRLCIMYCPEADTIMLNTETMKAVVVIPRCKGCDLCKVVCSTHNAITMHPVNLMKALTHGGSHGLFFSPETDKSGKCHPAFPRLKGQGSWSIPLPKK